MFKLFPASLRSKPALTVSIVLGIQIVLFYVAPTAEYVPNPPPLSVFSSAPENWRMVSENPLDPETQAFLRADDTLNRTYASPQGGANLFVAFFKSQRAGVTPHSPKVCLPGAGWIQEKSSVVSIDVPGEQGGLQANRYIVSRGEYRSLVYYWYATQRRTIAGEYTAKLWLMYDGLRYRRSDEALVRVITPVIDGKEPAADALAISFIRGIYGPLKQQMWTQ